MTPAGTSTNLTSRINRMTTHTQTTAHTHTHTHGNGDEDNGNGNEDRIGEGGREAKKHKKPQNSCRRHVGTGETWVERGKNVEKKGLVQ